MSNIKDKAETIGAIAGAAIAVIMLYGIIAGSVKNAKKQKLENLKVYVVK
jgi:hypothetical protein